MIVAEFDHWLRITYSTEKWLVHFEKMLYDNTFSLTLCELKLRATVDINTQQKSVIM